MNELMRKLLFLPEQASTVAADIDTLHYFVITATMLGAITVAGVIFIFLILYRRRAARGGYRSPDERPMHSRGGLSIWLELAVFGGLLSLFIAFWVIGFRQYVRLQAVPDDAIEVYVSGKQWMWSFAYPNGGGSNGVLYVPVNRPVKLVMTSRDVIHSFYVPAFRVKQDVVPGRMTTLWFEARTAGTYQIFCTEYCGSGHSTMRGQVVVVPPQEFQQRIDQLAGEQVAGPSFEDPAVVGTVPGEAVSMAEMGERVATQRGCLRCHTVDGTPHIGPTWAGAYGENVLLQNGERIQVYETYLTESMMDPLAKIRAGFQPVMPPYQGLLSAAETGALVEYIRSLRYVQRDETGAPLPRPGNLEVTPSPGTEEEEK